MSFASTLDVTAFTILLAMNSHEVAWPETGDVERTPSRLARLDKMNTIPWLALPSLTQRLVLSRGSGRGENIIDTILSCTNVNMTPNKYVHNDTNREP